MFCFCMVWLLPGNSWQPACNRVVNVLVRAGDEWLPAAHNSCFRVCLFVLVERMALNSHSAVLS